MRSIWGKVPAIPAALTLLLLFLAAFAGIFGYFLAQGANQTSRNIEQRSEAAAQVVATNAYWIAQVARQTLLRVDVALGPDIADVADIPVAVEALPEQAQVYLADAQGNVIFTTIPSAGGVSVADREYFVALRDGEPFVTSPLLTSRVSGEPVFVFGKRVVREGAFAGAIIVSFPVSVLEEIWRSMDIEGPSTISLVRDDGMLMARLPPTNQAVDLSGVPLFTKYLAAAPAGTYHSESSPIDGVARVVSYRQVPGTEIIALASVASGEAWASFRGAVVAVFVIASPIILGLLIGSVWIIRLLYRDDRRKRELEEALEANTLLFREIHHRVKNNLQSVQALVRMQDMPDHAKRDLQSRLAAMAAMHQHIYQHDNYVRIDAHDYVPAIAEEVARAYGVPVEIEYEVAHLHVDRDHATPLALLLSELITNALKYAYSADRKGLLRIRMEPAGTGRAHLTVRDNGVGIGDAYAGSTSMGMRLIKGVVAQMAGTYAFRTENGTVFEAELAVEVSGHPGD